MKHESKFFQFLHTRLSLFKYDMREYVYSNITYESKFALILHKRVCLFKHDTWE